MSYCVLPCVHRSRKASFVAVHGLALLVAEVADGESVEVGVADGVEDSVDSAAGVELVDSVDAAGVADSFAEDSVAAWVGDSVDG